jgi:DNA/RNA endonuclease G (NUC1)
MKKFTLIFLILLPIFSLSQRAEVKIDAGIYQVVYSEVYQQPLKVSYEVLCPSGTASRKGMNFFTNDSIITSDNLDYVNNVWDKGHMAPAAAFTCDIPTLKKTFSYLNCSLQHENLNRGVWRLLEEHERNLAKSGKKVKVDIIVDFTKGQKIPTGATVPSGYWKTIYVNGKAFECYYFPNEKPTKKTYFEYKIPSCN